MITNINNNKKKRKRKTEKEKPGNENYLNGLFIYRFKIVILVKIMSRMCT